MHYSQILFNAAAAHILKGNKEKAFSLLVDYYQHMLQLEKHDTISFGRHRITCDVQPIGDDAPERPITWEIIDKQEDGELLLISEYVLDWDAFDGLAWEDSYIRKKLNRAYPWFTDFEICLLRPNPDPVFLLSLEEAESCFQRPASAYAFMLVETSNMAPSGIEYTVLEEVPIKWWLRSSAASGRIAYVDTDGSIIREGFRSSADEFGIRPAIRLDLNQIMKLITF